MDAIVVVAMIVSAISTAVIAFFSIASWRLTNRIAAEGTTHQDQFQDLLQAIVVSNMTQHSGGAVSISIENFKKYYNGTTRVF